MARERHLRHAPITEAIIDFRVKLPKEFKVEEFHQLKGRLRDRYPTFTKLTRTALEIRTGQPPREVQPSEGIGLLFKSQDELNLTQFRIDGFTFNRLRPYTEWETVFQDAFEAWRVYLAVAHPEFIMRIATRYINHLALPVPRENFSEYLESPVTIPEGIHGKPRGFLSRLNLEEIDGNVAANITQALEHGKKPDEVVIRLDIDAYKVEQIEVDDTSIPSYFDSLRNVKNQIFFKSITEKAVRFFE